MGDVAAVPGPVAQLGECPVWSEAEQVLYWEDIDGCRIHRFDPSTQQTTTKELPTRPGSFALTDRVGTLLVATEHHLVVFDWDTAAVTPWTTLEPAGTGNRLNDGRCDPFGRYVVGSMYEVVSEQRSSGILHSVGTDGQSATLRTGVGVSNGIAFDPDRGRMFFADSFTGRVLVFDYDPNTGEANNERVFFDYAAAGVAGSPDGACVDADGYYWSASVFGSAMTRITPDGDVDYQIPLPINTPTMPAFGGPDLTTLYITTLSAEHAPGAAGTDGFEPGQLLAIDLDVAGRPEPLFPSNNLPAK